MKPTMFLFVALGLQVASVRAAPVPRSLLTQNLYHDKLAFHDCGALVRRGKDDVVSSQMGPQPPLAVEDPEAANIAKLNERRAQRASQQANRTEKDRRYEAKVAARLAQRTVLNARRRAWRAAKKDQRGHTQPLIEPAVPSTHREIHPVRQDGIWYDITHPVTNWPEVQHSIAHSSSQQVSSLADQHTVTNKAPNTQFPREHASSSVLPATQAAPIAVHTVTNQPHNTQFSRGHASSWLPSVKPAASIAEQPVVANQPHSTQFLREHAISWLLPVTPAASIEEQPTVASQPHNSQSPGAHAISWLLPVTPAASFGEQHTVANQLHNPQFSQEHARSFLPATPAASSP